MKTSVIIPSLKRPAQLMACVQRLKETTCTRDVECVVVVDGGDLETLAAASQVTPFVLFNNERLGPMVSWNRGLRMSHGETIAMVGDDVYFHDGWLYEALKVMDTLPDKSGVVGFNDLYRASAEQCAHFLITRECIKNVMGGVLCFECYQTQYTDNETVERAKRANCFAYAPNSIVEHRHWRVNKADKDVVYQIGETGFKHDYAMFNKRKDFVTGFPNDFKPVIQ
jgi:glycosyltransferase involved in cell wall biosynthesis